MNPERKSLFSRALEAVKNAVKNRGHAKPIEAPQPAATGVTPIEKLEQRSQAAEQPQQTEQDNQAKSAAEKNSKEWHDDMAKELSQGKKMSQVEMTPDTAQVLPQNVEVLSQNNLLESGAEIHSPVVAQALNDVISYDLINNPDGLYVKAAQLKASLRSDMPEVEQSEIIKTIDKFRNRAIELYEQNGRHMKVEKIEDIEKFTEEEKRFAENFYKQTAPEVPEVKPQQEPKLKPNKLHDRNFDLLGNENLEGLSQEARDYLDNNVLKPYGDKFDEGIKYDFISNSISETIQNHLNDPSADNPLNKFSQADREKLGNLANELRRHAQEGQMPRYSSIYLEDHEIRDIMTNYKAWFAKNMDLIEIASHDPQQYTVQSRLDRMKLASQFLGSEHFDKARLQFDQSVSERDKKIFYDFIDKYRQDPLKIKLADEMNARLDTTFAYYEFMATGDFKRFTEKIRSIGDAGIISAAAADGGIAGQMATRYESIVNGIISNKQRFTPEIMDRALTILEDQIAQEAPLYEEAFRKSYMPYQIGNTLTEFNNTDLPSDVRLTGNEVKIKAIAARARMIWRLRMRTAVTMERGFDPGKFDYGTGGASYQTLSAEEKMLGAARIRDWFFRKWGNKSEVLGVWNEGAYFTAKHDHVLNDYVRGVTDKLWRDTHVKGILSKDQLDARNEAIDKITYMLKQNLPIPEAEKFKNPNHFNITSKDEIIRLEEVRKLEESRKVVMAKITNMGKGGLERLVAIEEGGFRMQRLLRPYFYLDSGWRNGLYEKFIGKAFNNPDGFGLGIGLRQKGEAYFFNPEQRFTQDAANKFQIQVNRAAKYRPHSMSQILYYGGSEHFNHWFNHNKSSLGFENGNDMFTWLDRRFQMINSQIMRENLPAINYKDNVDVFIKLSKMSPEMRNQALGGMSGDIKAQWQIIDKVYFNEKVQTAMFDEKNPVKFFETMKALQENSDYSELFNTHHGSIKYDRFFLTIPSEDDIPDYLLQDVHLNMNMKNINKDYWEVQGFSDANGKPLTYEQIMELIKNDPTKIENLRPIAMEFSEKGLGPGSPLFRAWNDYSMAIENFEAILNNRFNPDQKEFIKLLRFINDKVDAYQGPFLAHDAVIKLLSAWGGAAISKPEYRDAFKSFNTSSVFRDLRGGHAPSLGVEGIDDLLEQVEMEVGRLDLYDKHSAHALEDFLRLSTVQFGKFNTHISWHSIYSKLKIDKFLEKTEKMPIIGKFLNTDMLEYLDRNLKLGVWQYRFTLGMAFVAVLIMANAYSQAKQGQKESH